MRACFSPGPCERKALASQNERVYGLCRVENGLSVDGITTWVKTPWRFVPGAVAADGSANASQSGFSDTSSSDFGWITAAESRANCSNNAASGLLLNFAGTVQDVVETTIRPWGGR